MPISLSDIASMLPSAGPGNVNPTTGVGEGPIGANGGLGGVLAAQKMGLADQQLGMLNQSSQMSLQNQALQLQQAQSDESTFGQQARDVKSQGLQSQLDLWKQGILGDLDKNTALTSLSDQKLKQLSNNLQTANTKNQVSESILEMLPQGGIPPSMMDDVKSFYKKGTGEDLPDDPMEAYAKIQHDGQLNKTSAPRIQMALQQINDMQKIKQTGANEQAVAQTRNQGELGVAGVQSDTAKAVEATRAAAANTPNRVYADLQQKFATDPKSMTTNELATLSSMMMKEGNASVPQAKALQLVLLQSISDDQTLSPSDKAKKAADTINQYKMNMMGPQLFAVDQQLSKAQQAAATDQGSASTPTAKSSTPLPAPNNNPNSWDKTQTISYQGNTYVFDAQRKGWVKQ